MEDLAFDRSSLEDRAVFSVETVEARTEQRLDRGRERDLRRIAGRRQPSVSVDQQPFIDEHGDHLLGEKRIPLGRLGDAEAQLMTILGRAEQVRDKPLRCVGSERRQEKSDRALGLLSPVRAVLEQIRARHADDQDREPHR